MEASGLSRLHSEARRDERGTACCAVNGHALEGAAYALAGGLRCRRHALSHTPTLRRFCQIAAVVGTALFLINQLDVVVAGKADATVIAKILLTYLVPFLVATYSALAGAHRPES